MRRIYDYAVEIDSRDMIHIQIFMKIPADIQAILRFSLRKLRGCNVGITNGRDL
jgi:hypothetical protein